MRLTTSKHHMSAAELVVWMATHASLPTLNIKSPRPITIHKARSAGPYVDLTVQSGDEAPHVIKVRADMIVTIRTPSFDPVFVS